MTTVERLQIVLGMLKSIDSRNLRGVDAIELGRAENILRDLTVAHPDTRLNEILAGHQPIGDTRMTGPQFAADENCRSCNEPWPCDAYYAANEAIQ